MSIDTRNGTDRLIVDADGPPRDATDLAGRSGDRMRLADLGAGIPAAGALWSVGDLAELDARLRP